MRDLSKKRVDELCEEFDRNVDRNYEILKQLHDGKAWKAYKLTTWAEFVSERFGMTRQNSYYLLNQANMIETFSKAAEVSTNVVISTQESRDLKPFIEEIASDIREAVKELPSEKARATVARQIIDDKRAEVKSSPRLPKGPTIDGHIAKDRNVNKVTGTPLNEFGKPELPPSIFELKDKLYTVSLDIKSVVEFARSIQLDDACRTAIKNNVAIMQNTLTELLNVVEIDEGFIGLLNSEGN